MTRLSPFRLTDRASVIVNKKKKSLSGLLQDEPTSTRTNPVPGRTQYPDEPTRQTTDSPGVPLSNAVKTFEAVSGTIIYTVSCKQRSFQEWNFALSKTLHIFKACWNESFVEWGVHVYTNGFWGTEKFSGGLISRNAYQGLNHIIF